VSSPGHGSARVQEILTALIKQRLGASLERVEEALGRWRAGEVGPFEAHAEVLSHVARADSLAAAMSKTGRERTASLLRAAQEAGLVSPEELRTLTGLEPDQIPPPADLDAEPSAEVRLPAKRDVVTRLLGEGTILVHLDSRRSGVSVPDHLRSDPRLVLRFGYGLTPAIADLEVGEDALSGTLSFRGRPHRCVLPWSSVYAVISEGDQRGMVWPDDVPPEAMTADPEDPAEAGASTDEPAAAPRARGHLKLVD
jgi:stringent starvation protein B